MTGNCTIEGATNGVRCVTFDVGGTLLHPYPSVGEIYDRTFRKFGVIRPSSAIDEAFFAVWETAHEIPREASYGSEKPWWREIVRRILLNLDVTDDKPEIFEELWNVFCHPDHWRLYDGAVDALVELRRRGYVLSVLSNWDERLRPLLHDMDLLKYFDFVVISCEVGVEKPHKEIFDITARTTGFHADEILHIGDSEHHDLAGARDAGWNCLLVAPGGNAADRLTDLRELPDVVECYTSEM